MSTAEGLVLLAVPALLVIVAGIVVQPYAYEHLIALDPLLIGVLNARNLAVVGLLIAVLDTYRPFNVPAVSRLATPGTLAVGDSGPE